jgi:hypothetical protein
MGDITEAEKNWNTKARVMDYKCEMCGVLIPYGEQKVYFDTKMCAHCAHKMEK